MSRPIQTLAPEQQPRRRRKAQIAGVMAAALVISWGGPAANAFWQTISSNAGGAKADSIQAVAAPTASASAGAASVSWLAGSTAAGRPVSGYTLARYSSATGGVSVAASGGCAGTISALSCSEAALPAGTWYYTVTPVLGSWVGVESARSAGVAAADTERPDPPVISAAGTVNIANVTGVPVSGTAEAGSSVTVTATGLGGVQASSQPVIAATGTGAWTVSNFDLTGLSDGVISYTAVATDSAGNTSGPTVASTTKKDTAAPTATVTLFNSASNIAGTAETGDTVSIKYSGDINSKSICSTWDGLQSSEITGNNVVTVTINSNILAVTTTGAAACTPLIGQVNLGTSYGTGSLTFKGNSSNGVPSKIAWNNGTQTLTITLGSRTGNGAASNVGLSSPTVVPPAGVTDLNGNQAVGVAPAAASRF